MEVSKLDVDELDYELRVRGYSALPDDTVSRNVLRALLKSNENNLENYVIQKADEEVAVCSSKLRELKNLIDSITGDKMSDNYRKANTKINHLLGRIDRITTTDDRLMKSRSVLLKTVLYLMEEMEARAKFASSQPKFPAQPYEVTPVTRTLIVANTKMIASAPPVDQNNMKKETEIGTEIFSHQGVALKKKNQDSTFDPISGTLGIIQYKSGKYVEWKPTEVSFETENTDAEWESVDAVRRRTCSTSSNVENYSQIPPIKMPMQELKSYKIKSSARQISLRTKDNSRYSFLFQCGNSDGFISALRAILVTRRAGHSRGTRSTYHVLDEREESKIKTSFNELDIFPDMNGHSQANVWNFMRSFHARPYEATMQTFSKLTDTLLYRTPEQRPVDAEVAELLTRSLHTDDNEKALGSDYTMVEESRNIVLDPRQRFTRNEPLNDQQWASCLDTSGRVTDQEKVKQLIFKGGVDPYIRFKVWKYLLKYYPWNATTDECNTIREQKSTEYFVMKRQWQAMTPGQEERFSSFRERKSLIEKDVNRTDRTLPFYAGDDNQNLKILNDILMTYVMYNFDLGYVQGMSDLLSPILYLMGNEVDAFWCFTGFMDRVFHNFDLDQAGMKKQLSELYSLLKVVTPELALYLSNHDSANMFFCFRWLLVHFKREFSLSDIMTLWEILWTNLPCQNFHLIICVAILDLEKRELMKPGNGFTEILKYVNELSCRMDLSNVLCEAEAIYEQLKAADENVPLSVRRIVGLAPVQENDSENSDEESFRNNKTTVTSSIKNSDDNDSIIDDMEKVTFTPDTGEIGFEGFERAIASNYY